MIVDKEKQWNNQVQDEEVLLYKLYNILSYKSKTSKLIFIQDEVDNLNKYINYMQSLVKTILFYLPLHYKSIWPQIYIEELPHKPYFIMLTL